MRIVSKTVGNRRLLKLADLLDRLPAQRFNMDHWVGEDWKGRQDLSCGTTACALGWATTIPSLRKAGLRLIYGPLPRVRFGDQPLTGHWHDDSISAGAAVFGLNHADSNYLFMATRIKNPKKMAEHIRKFVKYQST